MIGGPRAHRILAAVLSWTVLAGVVALVWPAAFGGCTGFTIVSGHSMDPTYATGDLVVTRCGTPHVGDIAVYRATEAGGSLVVHRVVGGDARAGFVFQGDNNPRIDPFSPVGDDVVGVVRLHVPAVGRLGTALATPGAAVGLLVVALAVFVWPGRERTAPAVAHTASSLAETPAAPAEPTWVPS